MTFKEAIADVYNNNTWEAGIKLTCGKCGVYDYPKTSLLEKNNAIKAECKSCNSYIKFLPQRDLIQRGL